MHQPKSFSILPIAAPASLADMSDKIEGWKIPDWIKVDDNETFKNLCDIHCQNEEEIRQMTEMRRKLQSKELETPVITGLKLKHEVEGQKQVSKAPTQTTQEGKSDYDLDLATNGPKEYHRAMILTQNQDLLMKCPNVRKAVHNTFFKKALKAAWLRIGAC